MRGEYQHFSFLWAPPPELPPRARRIQRWTGGEASFHGTTSACAENTLTPSRAPLKKGNYLRVRGEYHQPYRQSFHAPELPPRARRILDRFAHLQHTSGTTSACAENTPGFSAGGYFLWNYLRVRGEYKSSQSLKLILGELPPRARRIPPTAVGSAPTAGTTSACAENTLNLVRFDSQTRNYLRVRGEYLDASRVVRVILELPPRARRIPRNTSMKPELCGTTSACAENTHQPGDGKHGRRNYLRVRGEYSLPP